MHLLNFFLRIVDNTHQLLWIFVVGWVNKTFLPPPPPPHLLILSFHRFHCLSSQSSQAIHTCSATRLETPIPSPLIPPLPFYPQISPPSLPHHAFSPWLIGCLSSQSSQAIQPCSATRLAMPTTSPPLILSLLSSNPTSLHRDRGEYRPTLRLYHWPSSHSAHFPPLSHFLPQRSQAINT